MGLRAEDISLVEGDNFTIELIENLGSEKLIYLSSAQEKDIVARVGADDKHGIGDRCNLKVNEKGLHIFDAKTEKRI